MRKGSNHNHRPNYAVPWGSLTHFNTEQLSTADKGKYVP